jgi:hypothetical protein
MVKKFVPKDLFGILWRTEYPNLISMSLEGRLVVVQTVRMGKKRGDSKPNGSPEASRKPFKPARIRKALAEIAEARAEELAQDFTQYVNDAVRMRLEQEGRWPPVSKK